jgi:hypothetical protein
MMTVIFVLFIVFLVPLVSLDRMQLEGEHRDPFWHTVIESFFRTSGNHDSGTLAYIQAFELDNAIQIRTRPGLVGSVMYVEAFLPDSSVTVIEHDLSDNRFTALYCQEGGSIQLYRNGTLAWNRSSGRWAVFDCAVDYGDSDESGKMQRRYRTFFKKNATEKQGA